MKVSTTTIIFACISIAAILYIIRMAKDDRLGIRSAVLWFLLWLGIGFFSLFPEMLNALMKLAQMENRMFFIPLMAIFVLFLVVFNLSSRMDSMHRTVSTLAKEIALLKYQMEDEFEKPKSG